MIHDFNSCKISFYIELKSASSSGITSQKLSETHANYTSQLIRQTNMLCEHRQLRRACANAQSYQGIRCSHTPWIYCWIHRCARAHIKKGDACRRKLRQ